MNLARREDDRQWGMERRSGDLRVRRQSLGESVFTSLWFWLVTFHECFLSVSMRWLPPLLLLLLAGDRVGVISFTNYRWESHNVGMLLGGWPLLGWTLGREKNSATLNSWHYIFSKIVTFEVFTVHFSYSINSTNNEHGEQVDILAVML